MVLIFIENLFINYLIIFEVVLFTKNKFKFFKNLFLSILLSSNVLFRNLDNLNYFFIFILFINIIIYLLFRPKSFIKYLKYIWYFVLIYIEFIGFIIFSTLLFNFKIDSFFKRVILYNFTFFIVYIFNNFTWKIWQNNILNDKLTYILYLPKLSSKFKIYLDTGNFLKDELGIYEVILLNEDNYLKKIKNKNIFSNLEEVNINVNTINSYNNLKGYIFENVIIENNKHEKFYLNKAIILFTSQKIIGNKYDGLLGINTYINKLKGVNL